MGVWIGVAASFVSIAVVIAGVVSKFAKMEQRMETNEKRDAEERTENRKKFEELYNSRNKQNELLIELATSVKDMNKNIDRQFESLDRKIDELQKEIKCK